MAKTVVVTGASGFIGTHLCEALAKADWRVRGIDRADPSPGFSGDFAKVDITRARGLGQLLSGATHVVHLAALASVEDSAKEPDRARRDTVETTRLILKECKSSTRFVLASTAAVYSPATPVPQKESIEVPATSIYANAKLESEKLVRDSGVDGVCLRLFNVYGPGQQNGIVGRIVDCARGGQTLRIQGDGEQTRDFLHVGDAARAFMLALDAGSDFGGQAINIGSGDEISINALVRLAVEVGGTRIKVEYGAPRPDDLRRSCADLSRARTALQFEAGISLAVGLGELFAAN